MIDNTIYVHICMSIYMYTVCIYIYIYIRVQIDDTIYDSVYYFPFGVYF